ncbi:diguanylate cyclase [uncultured Cellulomonas sp.]|uniref:histidine kinase N-terminal 7TM domain-containing diguanylate cyclase n=1 Tax=uncultured Cellulomonas sp. TaxID=189682 RepID=UPI00262D97FD|nr:diguanylate cyclase [uncultured Cellulomonas sp.]
MPSFVETVSLLAAVVAVATSGLVLRRRRTSPLALPLALMLVGAAQWAAARALLGVADTLALRVVLEYAVFPGAAVVSGASFWYFMVLAGHGAALSRRTCLLLAVHPCVLLVVLATDPWHHLFLRPLTGDDDVISVGPLFWVHTAYSYGLLLRGLGAVFRAMLHAVPGHRHVHAIVLTGAALPFAGNVGTHVLAVNAQTLHLTPVFFLASAVLWWWVERYGHLDGVVPVSTRQVLEAIADAVVVVDPRGRVLDANLAARRLVRESGGGAGSRVVGADWGDVVAAELRPALTAVTGTVLTTASGTVLDVRVTTMSADGGRGVGSVVVLRDVTELERLRTELAEQAMRDGLTGLHNRRYLEGVLTGTGAGVTPVSAVMVDVDHFKRVNDEHGHAVGDRVLVEVARVLAESVRDGDTVARFGGEEFVLLLPGASMRVAERRAEDVRARCAAIRVRTPRGEVGVTISAGVATRPADEDPEHLLRLADAALYAAKAGGRDAVVSAPVAA